MKKIMFNDKYGLTQAVLEGRKTMTRRVITIPEKWHGIDVYGFCHAKGQATLELTDGDDFIIEDPDTGEAAQVLPTYKIGEEVAVAQSYRDCWGIYQRRWESYNNPSDWRTPDAILGDSVEETAGWGNKMFVRADLMPHRIRITGIKVERLQDISDEDCLREGIRRFYVDPVYNGYTFTGWKHGKKDVWCNSPRNAFAKLIDKVGKHGTWDKNPYVFAYEFETINS